MTDTHGSVIENGDWLPTHLDDLRFLATGSVGDGSRLLANLTFAAADPRDTRGAAWLIDDAHRALCVVDADWRARWFERPPIEGDDGAAYRAWRRFLTGDPDSNTDLVKSGLVGVVRLMYARTLGLLRDLAIEHES